VSKDFNALKIGKDISWSDGLMKALDKLHEYEYVFLFLEDLFIVNEINNKRILDVIDSFILENGNYLTFVNEPKHNLEYNEFFGVIVPGSLYRVTATFSLWNINMLKKLLRQRENAWEFERKGSIRSDKYSGFYSLYNSEFKFINCVVKGKWIPEALNEVRKQGFPIAQGNRDVFSKNRILTYKLYKLLRSVTLSLIPFKYKRRIANLRGDFKGM